jgi:acetyl/propionyl-CoA carboxylase alpha subunit
VIRGVASNISFQAALMQHPRFTSGNFNTGLIADQYPKGFNAADVPHDDPLMLVASPRRSIASTWRATPPSPARCRATSTSR